jgi:hypothetical protein
VALQEGEDVRFLEHLVAVHVKHLKGESLQGSQVVRLARLVLQVEQHLVDYFVKDIVSYSTLPLDQSKIEAIFWAWRLV